MIFHNEHPEKHGYYFVRHISTEVVSIGLWNGSSLTFCGSSGRIHHPIGYEFGDYIQLPKGK